MCLQYSGSVGDTSRNTKAIVARDPLHGTPGEPTLPLGGAPLSGRGA